MLRRHFLYNESSSNLITIQYTAETQQPWVVQDMYQALYDNYNISPYDKLGYLTLDENTRKFSTELIYLQSEGFDSATNKGYWTFNVPPSYDDFTSMNLSSRNDQYIDESNRYFAFSTGGINVIFGTQYRDITELDYSQTQIENFTLREFLPELDTLILPLTVKRLENKCFYECERIDNIVNGEGIEYVSDSAFSSNALSNFRKLYAPLDGFALGNTLIAGADKADYIISENISALHQRCFQDAKNISTLDLTKIDTISSYAFYNSSIQNFTVKPDVVLQNYCFENCKKLQGATIPEQFTDNRSSSSSYNINPYDGCTAITHVNYYCINGECSSRNGLFPKCKTQIKTITFGDKVTTIPPMSWKGCSNITTITIPSSVTSIGNSAFGGCSGLTKTNYTGDIEGWCGINFGSNTANPIHYSHNLYINDKELKNLVVPSNITTINNYAFYNCSSLSSITFHKNIVSVGKDAFNDCTALTSVNINDLQHWTQIDFATTAANPIRNTNAVLYFNNEPVTTFIASDEYTTIKNYVFNGCSTLKSITIGKSTNNIGEFVFGRCPNIESISVDNVNSTYDSRENCNAIIETATNTIIVGCKNTTIPNGITTISAGAFLGCTGLTNIIIPDSVTMIGQQAFAECGLTSVIIPSSVTNVPVYAFDNCQSLQSLTIQNGSIGQSFTNCTHLQNIVFGENVSIDSKSAFSNSTNIKSITWNVKNHSDFKSSLSVPFYDTKYAVTSVTFGESVEHIPAYLCYYFKNLKNITIPDNVTSIGKYAFEATGISTLTIPDTVTTIGEGILFENNAISNVVYNANYFVKLPKSYEGEYIIPDGIKQICGFAFENCASITSVTIPSSVTSIGNYAFFNSHIPECIFNGTMEQWNQISKNSSWNSSSITTVKCTDGEITVS